MQVENIVIEEVDLEELVNNYITGKYVLLTVWEFPQLENMYNNYVMPLTPFCNCVGLKIVDVGGKYGKYNYMNEYNCMYCLKKISEGTCRGIPIIKKVEGGKLSYYTIDIFCSMECCDAEVDRRRNNPIYVYSSQYIRELFSLITGKPEHEIKPSSDRRLLKVFNGPLTLDEFHSKATRYTEKPGNFNFSSLTYVPQNTVCE